MGEIADALRRARTGGLLPGPVSRGRPVSGPDPGPVEPVPPPQTLQPTRPTDQAIAQTPGGELEACRQLALQLRIELERRGARSVAIVSALRAEGKTTTSCNLALALASLASGRSVALLDLDLRRPSVARVLGIGGTVGVERCLKGEASLEDARVAIEQSPLDVYPAFTPQRNAHEILTREALSRLVDDLERRYEVVVVDTPPTLLVPDARLILRRVPVCVPVARAGKTRVGAFRELIESLPRDQILSTLLNGKRRHGGYYHGYDYDESDEGADGDGGGTRRRSRRRAKAS